MGQEIAQAKTAPGCTSLVAAFVGFSKVQKRSQHIRSAATAAHLRVFLRMHSKVITTDPD